ncbi:hypothetical protein FHX79_113544 [Streptomyces cavourensis]|nr:hypothetical protein FHX79_113544 [Streptomyces cavourensis]GGU97036.1 hypothetical protein GCM10010498_65570 [Streptomyces cavourensis]
MALSVAGLVAWSFTAFSCSSKAQSDLVAMGKVSPLGLTETSLPAVDARIGSGKWRSGRAAMAARGITGMPTIHREPDFGYDDLVDLVEGQLRVVELTAVNAEIGGPGERLWMMEPGLGGDVYRLWRKSRGKGRGTYWAVDRDRPWEAVVWLREALSGVLGRLTRPGAAYAYALEPGREEQDLAVLDELEAVRLAGVEELGRSLGPGAAVGALEREVVIPAQAELARAGALRSRLLREHFGTGPDAAERAAAELGWDVGKARKALAAHDDYRTWVREGAAHARTSVPVHRPSGDTGLPARLAATLMTAACREEEIVPGRPSPVPIPDELAPWYVYVRGLGACIAVAVEGVHTPDGNPWEYMTVAPVVMVMEAGWTVHEGVIVSPVPYDLGSECVIFDEDAILAGGGDPQ